MDKIRAILKKLTKPPSANPPITMANYPPYGYAYTTSASGALVAIPRHNDSPWSPTAANVPPTPPLAPIVGEPDYEVNGRIHKAISELDNSKNAIPIYLDIRKNVTNHLARAQHMRSLIQKTRFLRQSNK